MQFSDYVGLFTYSLIGLLAVWLAYDLRVAWKQKGGPIARNLYIMSLFFVAFAVSGLVMLWWWDVIEWREWLRVITRLCSVAAMISMRWAIRAR